MLRKLGSPRKGSRFVASPSSPKDKNEPQELSSLGDGISEPKAPIASPAKKRLSLWSKKTPLPTDTISSPHANELTLNLPFAEPKAVPSIQEQPNDEAVVDDGTPTKPVPLKRTPRQRSILEPDTKSSPSDMIGDTATTDTSAKPTLLMRSPRQRLLLDDADVKASPLSVAKEEKKNVTKDEKKSRPSKRDSLGLKGLMAKREKAKMPDEKPEQRPESPSKPGDNQLNAGDRSPTRKKVDESPNPPLSPIRRTPRPSSGEPPPQLSTTASIREARSLFNRKPIAGIDRVPPTQQPEVHIIGEIVGGDGFGKPGDGYCCKWSVDYGNQWIHVAGDQVGQTQIDYAASLAPDERGVVWAHPIDLHFVTTALHGWPKMLLQVWRVDTNMKMNVVGYGFVHLPFAPGHHQLIVSLWRPMGTSKEELGAVLLGHTPELLTDEVLFNKAWAERCRLKTIATGRVHISVGIIVRNFDSGAGHLDM